MTAPTHVYVIRVVGGWYNPFFGSQREQRKASRYWTEQEATEIAKGLNALEVLRIPRKAAS